MAINTGSGLIDGRLTSETLNTIVADVLQRAPEWLRRDLCSPDANTRRTAEDTLAIMISGAIYAR